MIGEDLTRTHRVLNLSFCSTKYPRIGEPPSDAGGDQLTVREKSLTSESSGVSGAPGTPAESSKTHLGQVGLSNFFTHKIWVIYVSDP